MATTRRTYEVDGDKLQIDIPSSPSDSKTVEQHVEEMHEGSADPVNKPNVTEHESPSNPAAQSSNVLESNISGGTSSSNDELVRAVNQLIEINMEQTGYLTEIVRGIGDGFSITL